MERIIVTGATSMIGTALIQEALSAGIEVYAVVRASSGKRKRLPIHPGLHMIECELTELKELPDRIPVSCDTFYHIAWGNTGSKRNASAELQFRNIDYTLEAVKAAHALGCQRFIGAGSQAEYGPRNVERIAPDTPTEPTTPYGAAKLAANVCSRMLCRELGMEWIWPRIFSVYGIYEKESTMISSALRSMLKGEPTAFTPAEQRWDYLYSKDAGRAYLAIGERGKNGAVYCLGSGTARPLKEYIEMMAELLGVSETGIGRKNYPEGVIMNLCADLTALTEDTGFIPQYGFKEGILETIAWMKNSEHV